MTGTIVKGIGGFYSVASDDGMLFTLKAPKKLRQEGMTPTVGDRVECALFADGAFIERILPRKNELVRPPVANIDRLCAVMSASKPTPDLLLLDKLLLFSDFENIDPIIVVNKADEGCADLFGEYIDEGFMVLTTSAKTGLGREALMELISEGITCFAGQSAVGKSSLINMLYPGFALSTGAISQRTEHGRHTTRRVELFRTSERASILDTPGFSLLETFEIDPTELSSHYRSMRKAQGECRFAHCSHISEPDCAVKALVSEGTIGPGRYERYVRIYGELMKSYKRRFD